jgi:hypothetical protein
VLDCEISFGFRITLAGHDRRVRLLVYVGHDIFLQMMRSLIAARAV